MGSPVAPQHPQTGGRQWNISIFAAFPMMQVKHLTFPVDLFDLQVDPFQQAQSTGIDDGQADPIALMVYAVQDTSHFLNTQYHREFMLMRWTQEIEGLPLPSQGMLKEELDPAQGDGAGVAGGMLDVLEIQKILA